MTWLIQLILGLFGKWLNRTPQIAPVAEQLGKTEVERDDAQAGERAVAAAKSGSDAAYAAAINDPDSLRAPDPDSRD